MKNSSAIAFHDRCCAASRSNLAAGNSEVEHGNLEGSELNDSCHIARVSGAFRFLRALRRAAFVFIAGLILIESPAGAQELKREVFPPSNGKGAIVIVASGASGTRLFREFGTRLSREGYYAVLVRGDDVFRVENLRSFIKDAQSASQAIAGKAALIGFSLGGAGVLLTGTGLKEDVAAVVAYYPAITGRVSDYSSLAAKMQVPVLLLAGVADTFYGCCMIESMRSLAAAPKPAPFELVTFPDANHGFNLKDSQFTYRAQDDADSWDRTLTFLKHYQPPGGK